MKRTAGVMLLLATLAGCVNDGPSPFMNSYWGGSTAQCGMTCGGCRPAPSVPNCQGPWGQPIAMAAPYTSNPPQGEAAAREMLNTSLPLNAVQQANFTTSGDNRSGIVPAGGFPPPAGLSPPGVPAMPPVPGMAPPPGAGPPLPMGGPTAAGPPLPMGGPTAPGAVAAIGALTGPSPAPFAQQRTEVFFTGPPTMKVSWYAPSPVGGAGFTTDYIEAPGRYNFLQAAVYRLRLSDIPGLGNVELYPTLEVVPANHKTSAFLAHSAVPVSFTDEDFQQVAAGNYVVKVIYLPDPQFQDLAMTGPSELVSSRLEPGVDPIAEACRRGSILLVIRLGNIDLNLAHSPAMNAPSPYQLQPVCPPGAGPVVPGLVGAGQPAPGQGMPLAGANGPMPGPMGPLPGGPGMLPPPSATAPAVPAVPTGRLPDMAPLPQTGAQGGPTPAPTPAAMASQGQDAPPAEKKPSGRSWIIP
jgi:hypothetical protein